ncbi:MAG: hypothetical protein LC123_02900 [Burkholderiales bacterium]|nr:hypothetical protein [Rhodocyclaceae bacterium]MCQ3922951.1 hypothetical protein [Rhodocyclaceae bacterium]MCZ2418780.1 hypothetical protein [Burkholderiales bacterium]HNQ57607.1 hypothetical protein [Candidatus Desulfobacillus denitrificans]HNT62302.1 hypothetical protein [Candidatus Desulfobacillus denitrificans]
MRRRKFLAGLAVLPALTFSGCTTLADARAERGSGVVVNYAAPFDRLWSGLKDVLRELDLRPAGDNVAEGYILVEHGASAFSWGERVVIFVERIGTQGLTRVEVVSKAAVGTNATATDWAARIHEKLGQRFKRA